MSIILRTNAETMKWLPKRRMDVCVRVLCVWIYAFVCKHKRARHQVVDVTFSRTIMNVFGESGYERTSSHPVWQSKTHTLIRAWDLGKHWPMRVC